MNDNTLLDEDWYNSKKRFVRTKKFVAIETCLFVLISAKVLAFLFSFFVYFLFSNFSIFDFIIVVYAIMWRKISIGHDANISQKEIINSNLHNVISVLFIFCGIILYLLTCVSDVYSMVQLFYSDKDTWLVSVNFDWIQYCVFKALTFLVIILSIFLFRETSKAETSIRTELSNNNN